MPTVTSIEKTRRPLLQSIISQQNDYQETYCPPPTPGGPNIAAGASGGTNTSTTRAAVHHNFQNMASTRTPPLALTISLNLQNTTNNDQQDDNSSNDKGNSNDDNTSGGISSYRTYINDSSKTVGEFCQDYVMKHADYIFQLSKGVIGATSTAARDAGRNNHNNRSRYSRRKSASGKKKEEEENDDGGEEETMFLIRFGDRLITTVKIQHDPSVITTKESAIKNGSNVDDVGTSMISLPTTKSVSLGVHLKIPNARFATLHPEGKTYINMLNERMTYLLVC